MQPRNVRVHARSLVVLLALLSACSRGHTDGTGFPPGDGDVLIKDGPVHDLASFSARVLDVRLVKGSGNSGTKNLIDAPITVELLGLEDTSAWLGSGKIPRGTYSGVKVQFDVNGFTARAKDGTDVPVDGSAGTPMTVFFDAPAEVKGNHDYDRFVVDVDLDESLTGDMLGLVFVPAGDADANDGSQALLVDDLRGVVESASFFDAEIEIEAFADDDLSIPLGTITVTTPPGIVAIDPLGAPYGSLAVLYGDLLAGQTLIEVHGHLVEDGVLEALVVAVEDQSAGDDSDDEVKIEGWVAGLGAGTLELQIGEIEKGAHVADPVLGGLGDPAVISTTWNVFTLVLSEDGAIVDSSELALGQRVELLFPLFGASPFAAERVRILDVAASQATVFDDLGVPFSVIVHVDANDPLVLSGEVADDLTDVTVDLTTAVIELDTSGHPTLDGTELLIGLEVQTEGSFAAGTITADRLVVHAGRLTGTVSGTTPPTTFTIAAGTLVDPFGDTVTEVGPWTVQIDPACAFEGDAGTAEELMALFDGLGVGETLAIEVEGIGTGVAEEILALEIEAEVIVP